MDEKKARPTIVILENRQMIATILSDLLVGASYDTRLVARIEDAVQLLPNCQPGVLLVDTGMIRPEMIDLWQQLEADASAHAVPILTFSCSAGSDSSENLLVLRSPGDFASVVQKIEEEWRKKQPFLGTRLRERGLLEAKELEAALRIQRELAQVGRSYPLGDLLVRLNIISAEDLEQVLQEP